MGQRGFRFSSEVKTKYIVIAAFIVLALLAVYIIYGNPNRSSFGAAGDTYKVKITNTSNYPTLLQIYPLIDAAKNSWGITEFLPMNRDFSSIEYTFTEGTALIFIPYIDEPWGWELNNNRIRYVINSDLSRTQLNEITFSKDKYEIKVSSPPPQLPSYSVDFQNISGKDIYVNLTKVPNTLVRNFVITSADALGLREENTRRWARIWGGGPGRNILTISPDNTWVKNERGKKNIIKYYSKDNYTIQQN